MIGYEELVQAISEKDVREINGLLVHLMTDPPVKTAAEIADTARTNPLFLARDMEYGQAIVGMATLVPLILLCGRIGRIEDLVVHPDYRGRGIGYELMTRLIGHAVRLGLKQLDLTSRATREGANRLYLNLGFEIRQTNVYRKTLVASR